MSLQREGESSGVVAEGPVVGRADVAEAAGAAGSGRERNDRVTQALAAAAHAVSARQAGDELAATDSFRVAVALALEALEQAPLTAADLALPAAEWALDGGDGATARALLARRAESARAGDEEGWGRIADVERWRDSWLIATVRRTPPDDKALDVLVRRTWPALFGRCQMLTLQREAAADLAQDAWCRVLRGRERLRPSGNFRAYLLMVATNLWRDAQRAALRAGALGDGRIASLDSVIAEGDGPPVTLAEVLPDLEQLEGAERARLARDLDHALGQLDVLSREVLVARFLDGESCAEIGRRHGRTEQTASGWVRRATLELKLCLENLHRGAP